MEDFSRSIASILLQIEAVKIELKKPFTWASGWRSPIYCDNRKILSFPRERSIVTKAFASMVKERFPEAEYLAGVATGAIAHGALVAQELNLPFVYVRSAPKSHGLTNLIEGKIETSKKVVVIEDLISTGGSSLQAVEALRSAGMEVLGMLAIFTYSFDVSQKRFQEANCPVYTLSNYHALIDLALDEGRFATSDLESLRAWRVAPDQWGLSL